MRILYYNRWKFQLQHSCDRDAILLLWCSMCWEFPILTMAMHHIWNWFSIFSDRPLLGWMIVEVVYTSHRRAATWFISPNSCLPSHRGQSGNTNTNTRPFLTQASQLLPPILEEKCSHQWLQTVSSSRNQPSFLKRHPHPWPQHLLEWI